MNASLLLEKLDRVRQVGTDRWTACCPSHQDRTPSLSISETNDGRILIHCFSGCDAQSILSAVGLKLSDLFPTPLSHHIKPMRSRVPLRDLVPLLDHESLIVYLTACDLLEKKIIDDESLTRLKMSVQRIGEVRDELN